MALLPWKDLTPHMILEQRTYLCLRPGLQDTKLWLAVRSKSMEVQEGTGDVREGSKVSKF